MPDRSWFIAFYPTPLIFRYHLPLMRIRILLPIKVMRICDHWSTDHPCLHLWAGLRFEPLKLLSFYFNTDSDLGFHSNTDPNPASKNNADTDPQPGLRDDIKNFP
jgi:hypothetical protein